MNEGPIARWPEQKRRSDWGWASVICVLALGCGVAVFLLTNVVIYALVGRHHVIPLHLWG
jgi:hypothetical protein